MRLEAVQEAGWYWPGRDIRSLSDRSLKIGQESVGSASPVTGEFLLIRDSAGVTACEVRTQSVT